MKTRLLLFMLIIFIHPLFAQLTGTKSIPGDYASIQQAISALNTVGVGDGGVTFEIAPGHAETLAGPTSGLITATGTYDRPIVFRKASGSGNNPLITAFTPGISTSVDGMIIIAGGDYITIDGIDLQENPANYSFVTWMEWGYALVKKQNTAPFDGCQHVTIKNCTITLTKNNRISTGIYAGNHIAANTNFLTITATSDAMNDVKIDSNSISNVFIGIELWGYAHPWPGPYTLYDHNNQIGVGGANHIFNFGGSAGGNVYYSYGIHTSCQQNIQVANNVISGGAGTARYVYGINIGTGYSSSCDIYNNDISVSGLGYPLYGIHVDQGGVPSGNTINIHGNMIHDCSYPGTSAFTFYAISQVSHVTYVNIYNNHIYNNLINNTGNFYGIYGCDDQVTYLNIYGNQIHDNQITGASGLMYCIFARTSIISMNNNAIYNNSIPLASATNGSPGIIYGYYNNDSPTEENYHDNQFYDLSVAGTNTAINSCIFGIYSKSGGTSVKSINNNQIHGLVVSTKGGGSTTGIKSLGGNTVYIKNNNIYDLETDSINALSYGIHIQSGTSVTVANNMISDLRTPQSNQGAAIQGIKIEGGTNGIFNNTIFLNAGSSTNTRFGTAGIVSHTGTVTDLRNNIVVNLSIPVHITGNAYCTAFQRTTTNLSNYSLSSNNNSFYCGEPDSWHLVYYDGTNTDSTLQQFKSRVFPRDTLSFSENVPFMNSVYAPYNLHVQASTYTRCESGGQVISTVLDDFDGDPRYPNTGYPEDPLFPATAPDVGADEFAGIPMNRTLTLLVFLEGLFDGMSLMNPASDENGPVWGADIADHIMVELHESFPPYSQAGVYEAVLHTNGVAVMNLDASCNGEYYIVIKHRNSLETWSSVPVAFDETVTSYNFSEGVSQAYGSNMLQAGLYSLIYGGDVNQDDIVDSGDMIPVDNLSSAFTTGYLPEDANGDGLVDSGDMILIDNNSGNFITIQRPE